MNISRSNYEIWFTDWLDNKLSRTEMEQLDLFLDENPDLRKEFNELSEFRLFPPAGQMPFRDSLKKEISNLSPLQFEMLCAAYYERDLSSEQEAEFLEIAAADQEKQRVFRLFGKVRLKSYDYVFRNKKALMKRKVAGKILRIAGPLLSAAAMIAIILLIIRPSEQNIPVTAVAGPLEIPFDSSLRFYEPSQHTANGATPREAATETINKTSKIISTTDTVARQINSFPKVDFSPEPLLIKTSPEKSLIAMGSVALPTGPEEQNDERNKLQRLLAFKFREKILNEDLPDNSPIQGFEIAEAGISGINKLLGWDMALSRNNDDDGETKSVYFSSRLIKFSAPVNKNELSE